jgi:hypothetical protein
MRGEEASVASLSLSPFAILPLSSSLFQAAASKQTNAQLEEAHTQQSYALATDPTGAGDEAVLNEGSKSKVEL